MKKLSRKNKIEMLIGRAVLNLLGGMVLCVLVLAFIYLLGILLAFAETHLWVFIILIIINVVIIFKEIL